MARPKKAKNTHKLKGTLSTDFTHRFAYSRPDAVPTEEEFSQMSSFSHEARFTNGQSTTCGSNVDLRHRRIIFVQGADLDFDNLDRNLSQSDRPFVSRDPEVVAPVAHCYEGLATHRTEKSGSNHSRNGAMGGTGQCCDPGKSGAFPAPVVEANRRRDRSTATTGSEPDITRGCSPTSSSGTEDVVLYKGRITDQLLPEKATTWDNQSRTDLDSEKEDFSDIVDRGAYSHRQGPESTHNVDVDDHTRSDDFSSLTSFHRERNPADVEGLKANSTEGREPILNKSNASCLAPDIGGISTTKTTDADLPREFGQSTLEQNARKTTKPFSESGTPSRLPQHVRKVLDKRKYRQRLQYLVVWEGCTTDEAQWVPLASLTSAINTEMINMFESSTTDGHSETDQNSVGGHVHELGDLLPTLGMHRAHEGAGGSYVDETQSEGLETGCEMSTSGCELMTDERLAYLLAKQEELGLDTDELAIFDGNDGRADHAVRKRALRSAYGRGRRKKTSDATTHPRLMASVLDEQPQVGYDIMDFDGPSIRRRSAKSRKTFSFRLSDSELEESIRSQWEADREKKRTKKQEREALRAQGLLGKRHKVKPHAQARDTNGMTAMQISEEIRQFLLSKDTSRSLPCMRKENRKIVHELSNALGLRSKSAGKGQSRFPTLYKTSKTRVFDDAAFDILVGGITGKAAKRPASHSNWTSSRSHRNRAGASSALVSYRDGDVVGDAAPEISSNNKGRLLLQKYGWSPGEGLGALGNKGIIQPVAHVVKVSKTGLG